MDLGPIEFVIVYFGLVLPVCALYWLIRLAVRYGMKHRNR